MAKISPKKSHWPLYGLLIVQLLTGITLMPTGNFISIYLNEVMAYPVRQVAQVIAWGQVVGMFASLVGGSLSAPTSSLAGVLALLQLQQLF